MSDVTSTVYRRNIGLLKNALESLHALDPDFGDDAPIYQVISVVRSRLNEIAKWRKQYELEKARKEYSHLYRYLWWFYPKKMTERTQPQQLTCTSKWYMHWIDTVDAAATHGLENNMLFHRDDGFYVLELQSPGAEIKLFEARTPLDKHGCLPSYTAPFPDSLFVGCDDTIDMLYRLKAELDTYDQWDGPAGVQFIILETCTD